MEACLNGYLHIPGLGLDDYPPAIGRGKGTRLVRGRNRRGWKADVAYVPSSEQRSFAAVLAIKLRRPLRRLKVPLRLLLSRFAGPLDQM